VIGSEEAARRVAAHSAERGEREQFRSTNRAEARLSDVDERLMRLADVSFIGLHAKISGSRRDHSGARGSSDRGWNPRRSARSRSSIGLASWVNRRSCVRQGGAPRSLSRHYPTQPPPAGISGVIV
jgi:hypothetical protein